MAEVTPDIEILEFAISREVQAREFFLTLAKRVDRPTIRKVFEELAAEEQEHKEKLELEVLKLGKTVSDEAEYAKPDQQFIISDDDSLLEMDYKDILMLGMEKEEASFRTYINLLGSVREKDSKDLLLALAEEEVRHKLRFQTEYDFLMKKKS
ncbi:MAG: ferritin-like domain-containing protein [Planctomycetota bacterium]|jgi:rubrerythrin